MKTEFIENVHEIKSEKFNDKRGSFLSCFKENEELFKKVWLDKKICQINLSLTTKKGTIRGLHYQEKPYQESKLIRCLRGKVWDVVIDLRKNSKTYKKWFSLELCSSKNNAILCFLSKCSIISSNNKMGAILNFLFSNLACAKIIEISISFCSPVEEISKFLLFFLLNICIEQLFGPDTNNS